MKSCGTTEINRLRQVHGSISMFGPNTITIEQRFLSIIQGPLYTAGFTVNNINDIAILTFRIIRYFCAQFDSRKQLCIFIISFIVFCVLFTKSIFHLLNSIDYRCRLLLYLNSKDRKNAQKHIITHLAYYNLFLLFF